MRVAVLLLALAAAAAPAHASAANNQGAWVLEAVPTVLSNKAYQANCMCAPDPIFPDPNCILCWCPPSNIAYKPPVNKGSRAWWGAAQPLPFWLTSPVLRGKIANSTALAPKLPQRTCGGAVPTALPTRLASWTPRGVTSAPLACKCAKDPILKLPQWVMCKCPKAKPINTPKVPTEKDYTSYPIPAGPSPATTSWPKCKGPYAICSFANCTLEYPGKAGSHIGGGLAACGCSTPGPGNNLTDYSLVDPAYILDKALSNATLAECYNVQGNLTQKCASNNGSPICKAITSNTIYGSTYDFISTYTLSLNLGGFTQACNVPGPGALYANCMTAACVRQTAFDGSPITCYCPVYRANTFLVGAPVSATSDLCQPNLPYLLSGVVMT